MTTKHSIHYNVEHVLGFAPTTITDNTVIGTGVIDCQGATDVEFAIVSGDLADADATFTALVEHGEEANLSDASPVDDLELLGTEAAASFAAGDDNAIKKVGYLVSKRYVRLKLTPANNTGSASFACVALKNALRHPV